MTLIFFFGSNINRFWKWYQEFVDDQITETNITCITKSLENNSIGITDVIFSCSRKDKSASDKHLTNKIYNHQFFVYPSKGESLKILCTSKGVMNEMLLNNHFFKLHPLLKINVVHSKDFQNRIIKKLKGDSNQIKNPFYKLIEVESGGQIECLALPSPGSPYRKLTAFGLSSEDSNSYLNNYLQIVFDWFIT